MAAGVTATLRRSGNSDENLLMPQTTISSASWKSGVIKSFILRMNAWTDHTCHARHATGSRNVQFDALSALISAALKYLLAPDFLATIP
jgi:hypothetical protein